MKVPADYICEHGMPQPWATCTDCMLLPRDQQPEPPRPEPAPPKPTKARVRKRTAASGSRERSPGGRSAAAKPRTTTRLPRSPDDEAPVLTGDKDLAYAIPAANLRYHVQGSDKDWLPISSLPHELSEYGWVYLQTDGTLAARCRVRGVGFREKRWTHEHADRTSDAGPGPTLELFGDDWEFVSIDLGPEGESATAGYRYLITLPDGSVRPAGDDTADTT